MRYKADVINGKYWIYDRKEGLYLAADFDTRHEAKHIAKDLNRKPKTQNGQRG